MKIALLTSNQKRHKYLASMLVNQGYDLFLISEITTLNPGKDKGIFKKSSIMENYFERVVEAENFYFHQESIANIIPDVELEMGKLSDVSNDIVEEISSCDVVIVFGSSFIKGKLAEALIKKRAINIHMGISPYYRGNSCNFWASYDMNLELVGATIHFLSKGLDNGEILFHSFPKEVHPDPFYYTMSAVKDVFYDLLCFLNKYDLMKISCVPQNKSQEIRYTKAIDFDDHIASSYLARYNENITLDQLNLKREKYSELIFIDDL